MLERLIPELFTIVIGFLQLEDLYSLRLTSRQLERNSIQFFSAAAFSNISVDFTPANLRWLRNVASHDDFRLAVRTLRIDAWDGKITRRKPICYTYGVGGHWPRSGDGRINYGTCDLAQEFFHSLSQFSNCSSITVTDYIAVSTYPPSHKDNEHHLSSADAVDLTLHALSTLAPGAPSFRRFHIAIRSGIDWNSPGWITAAAVASAKRCTIQLEELNLELRIDGAESITSLLQLIAVSPRIKALRIHLNPKLGLLLPQYINGLEHFPPPSLEEILLSGITMDEQTLAWILSKATETLQRLDLGCVTLTSGSWRSLVRCLFGTPFRKLRRFSMFACRDGPAGETIAFCPLWRAQKHSTRPMDGSRGASFYFWHSVTADVLPKIYHITGAAFESETGNTGTDGALRAMAGYSHRCPRGGDPGPRCVEMRETGEMFKDRVSKGEAVFHERWTGLPR